MKGPFIFALGHKARQGKSLAAETIHCAHPHETRIYSFADALKSYCRIVYDMREKDPALLQRIGMEFRAKSPDFWIRILEYRIMEEAPPIALVADLRFRNEADWVREHGGILVKVVRAGFISKDRPADHPSETELDDYPYDYVITAANNDTAGLQRQALDLFNALRPRRRA